ncbi:peptidase MA family metallohydrolase [Alkaliphilus serpentinus]|uniref:Peptidase MA-like domain-containing protein n=1 Tax=Alkaliphilus serpentinus TaxID=1482731 RepID=A0A833MAH1_9FIRM|nr:hypothetical protein [Alkaliphilus serpentinus]KAB3532183.1 hypothetical protein F8153_02695 [Alkaliphilus serpentinus]
MKVLKKFKYKFSLVWLAVFFLAIFLRSNVGMLPFSGLYKPVIRAVQYNYVSFNTRGFETTETENFIIQHQDIDEEIINYLGETAEDKYHAATKIFKYQPKNKVRMIVYNDGASMMKATMLNKAKSPMGVYYGNTIHILNPEVWYGDNQDYREVFYSEGPILHELVHLLTDHTAKGNFPTWFTEGVSLYFEYLIDGYQWGKELEDSQIPYSINQLTRDFYGLNQYKAYTKSFRLVDSFVENQGTEELIELIYHLGDGGNIKDFYNLFE